MTMDSKSKKAMEGIRQIEDMSVRHKMWLRNKYHTDVVFICGTERIHCHKFILSMESPVFDAAFNGLLPLKIQKHKFRKFNKGSKFHHGSGKKGVKSATTVEWGTTGKDDDTNCSVITIIDVSADHFKLFIQYLYTDTLPFRREDLEMVFDICYMAEKYQVHRLKKHCINFLINVLDHTNVVWIFQEMELIGSREFEITCLDFIQVHTGIILGATTSTDINSRTIFRIMEQKYLNVKREYVLIQRLLIWAWFHCQKEKGITVREMVAPLLKYFRFKNLKVSEFQLLCENFDFLTTVEEKEILHSLTKFKPMPLGFSNESKDRRSPSELIRIENCIEDGGTLRPKYGHYSCELRFCWESRPAFLHGVRVRGSRFVADNTTPISQLENITVKIIDLDAPGAKVYGYFQGEMIHGQISNINFQEPYLLQSDGIYALKLKYHNKESDIAYEFPSTRVSIKFYHPSMKIFPFNECYQHFSDLIVSQNCKEPLMKTIRILEE